jgi:hypothetical protein
MHTKPTYFQWAECNAKCKYSSILTYRRMAYLKKLHGVDRIKD